MVVWISVVRFVSPLLLLFVSILILFLSAGLFIIKALLLVAIVIFWVVLILTFVIRWALIVVTGMPFTVHVRFIRLSLTRFLITIFIVYLSSIYCILVLSHVVYRRFIFGSKIRRLFFVGSKEFIRLIIKIWAIFHLFFGFILFFDTWFKYRISSQK